MLSCKMRYLLDNQKDNKRAIRFYLETGLAKPKRRNKFYQNIQEEMLRGSNVRYDVEDQSKGDRQ